MRSRVAVIPRGSTDEEIVSIINSVIDGMRRYGRIDVSIPKGRPIRSVVWSNNSGWYQLYDAMDRRPSYNIDANMLIVIGASRSTLERVMPFLDPLPLYAGSSEARGQGEFSLSGISIPPRIKDAMIESETTGVPLDVQTRRALDKKFSEN